MFWMIWDCLLLNNWPTLHHFWKLIQPTTLQSVRTCPELCPQQSRQWGTSTSHKYHLHHFIYLIISMKESSFFKSNNIISVGLGIWIAMITTITLNASRHHCIELVNWVIYIEEHDGFGIIIVALHNSMAKKCYKTNFLFFSKNKISVLNIL